MVHEGRPVGREANPADLLTFWRPTLPTSDAQLHLGSRWRSALTDALESRTLTRDSRRWISHGTRCSRRHPGGASRTAVPFPPVIEGVGQPSGYRGGAVARVRRQAAQDDTPIDQRDGSVLYPVVPPDDGQSDFATPDLGCSGPVNNAPPASVIACAALTAQVAIDALMQRYEFPDEVIDVYRALPGHSPFDRLGRANSSSVPVGCGGSHSTTARSRLSPRNR